MEYFIFNTSIFVSMHDRKYKDIEIAIVDDHTIVREGVKLILSPSFKPHQISLFNTGTALLEGLNKRHYDLIIMDIKLPDITGFSLVPAIQELKTEQRILVYSMYPEKVVAPVFFKLGVSAYVNKEAKNEELLQAVRGVLDKGTFRSPALARYMAEKERGKRVEIIDKLSNREFEVLMLLLTGLGVLEISNSLSIKQSTAATYKARVLEKMEVKNIIELYKKSQLLELV